MEKRISQVHCGVERERERCKLDPTRKVSSPVDKEKSSHRESLVKVKMKKVLLTSLKIDTSGVWESLPDIADYYWKSFSAGNSFQCIYIFQFVPMQLHFF